MELKIYEDFRNKAMDCASKQKRAAANLRDASIRGDKTDAQKFAQQVRDYAKLYHDYNDKAAMGFYSYYNKDLNGNTIDLHRLHADEALEKIEDEWNKRMGQSSKEIKVIVGKGNHSPNGPILKNVVIDFAVNYGIEVIIDDVNAGLIHLVITDKILGRKTVTLSDYPITKTTRKSKKKRSPLCESPKIKSPKLNPSMPTTPDIVREEVTTATTETKISRRRSLRCKKRANSSPLNCPVPSKSKAITKFGAAIVDGSASTTNV